MTLHVYQSSLGTEKFHDWCVLPFPRCLLLWYLEYAVFREVSEVVSTDLFELLRSRLPTLFLHRSVLGDPEAVRGGAGKSLNGRKKIRPNFSPRMTEKLNRREEKLTCQITNQYVTHGVSEKKMLHYTIFWCLDKYFQPF